jgi:hypothetical protein
MKPWKSGRIGEGRSMCRGINGIIVAASSRRIDKVSGGRFGRRLTAKAPETNPYQALSSALARGNGGKRCRRGMMDIMQFG